MTKGCARAIQTSKPILTVAKLCIPKVARVFENSSLMLTYHTPNTRRDKIPSRLLIHMSHKHCTILTLELRMLLSILNLVFS